MHWFFKRLRHVALRDHPRHFEIKYMVQLHNGCVPVRASVRVKREEAILFGPGRRSIGLDADVDLTSDKGGRGVHDQGTHVGNGRIP